jgi:hypothetical protein
MPDNPLSLEIAAAQERSGLNLADLTVLTDDPYRLDTPTHHRRGQWFANNVARFVSIGTIHLRGLHYRISSAGDIARPDGGLYLNIHEHWALLAKYAAKSGRWLGYVPFDRVRDERNNPPDDYAADYTKSVVIRGGAYVGQVVEEPPNLELPYVICQRIDPRPAYRIILIGEKSSLRAELEDVALFVQGELILPTGDPSDTLIYHLARRIEADGRPAVILYFSDFDPSGYQMPVVVARKLQALNTLFGGTLTVEVHIAALTREQAEQYNLPSTPLKPTELRRDAWRQKFGREQTELDALIALHPGALRQIARDAVAPFFDDTLLGRSIDAQTEWQNLAREELEQTKGYQAASVIIRAAWNRVSKALDDYHSQLGKAQQLLPTITTEVDLPEAEIDYANQPEPLFTTDDDWVEATESLIAHKRYADVEDEDELIE